MPEIYLSLDFTGFYAIRQALPTIFLQWKTHLDSTLLPSLKCADKPSFL
jgi:hypothetical protein